jgi:hypothetical protein
VSAYLCQTLHKAHAAKVSKFSSSDPAIDAWFRSRAPLYLEAESQKSLFTVTESVDAIHGFVWSVCFDAVESAEGPDLGPAWAAMYWSLSGIGGVDPMSRAVELVYHTVNEALTMRPGRAFLWNAGGRDPALEEVLTRSEFTPVSPGFWHRRVLSQPFQKPDESAAS